MLHDWPGENMQEQRGLIGLLKNVVFSKIGMLGLVVAAAYFGYTHYQTIRRVEYNTIRRNIQVEEGYYQDPSGLSIDTPINENGKQEVYLVHTDSGARIPIRYDLLPENKRMLEGLLRRAQNNQIPAEEYKPLLKLANELETILLEQEMQKR